MRNRTVVIIYLWSVELEIGNIIHVVAKLTTTRFPSWRWPARLAASLETPSMRQPSPQKTLRFLAQRTVQSRKEGGTISVVVDEVKSILVVNSPQMCLSNSEADPIRKALTQGSSRNLDTIRMARFRVTRSQRVELIRVRRGA